VRKSKTKKFNYNMIAITDYDNLINNLSYYDSYFSPTLSDFTGDLEAYAKKLLNNGWEDISNSKAKAKGHLLLKESTTGLKIGFDKKTPGAKGFKGKDHYHIYNPSATSNKDLYLDKNGKPVRKGHTKSHILPEGD